MNKNYDYSCRAKSKKKERDKESKKKRFLSWIYLFIQILFKILNNFYSY